MSDVYGNQLMKVKNTGQAFHNIISTCFPYKQARLQQQEQTKGRER